MASMTNAAIARPGAGDRSRPLGREAEPHAGDMIRRGRRSESQPPTSRAMLARLLTAGDTCGSCPLTSGVTSPFCYLMCGQPDIRRHKHRLGNTPEMSEELSRKRHGLSLLQGSAPAYHQGEALGGATIRRGGMFSNQDEVLRYLRDNEVEFVDARFCDLPGIMQHFTFPVSNFGPSVFEEGLPFDGSSIADSRYCSPAGDVARVAAETPSKRSWMQKTLVQTSCAGERRPDTAVVGSGAGACRLVNGLESADRRAVERRPSSKTDGPKFDTGKVKCCMMPGQVAEAGVDELDFVVAQIPQDLVLIAETFTLRMVAPQEPHLDR